MYVCMPVKEAMAYLGLQCCVKANYNFRQHFLPGGEGRNPHPSTHRDAAIRRRTSKSMVLSPHNDTYTHIHLQASPCPSMRPPRVSQWRCVVYQAYIGILTGAQRPLEILACEPSECPPRPHNYFHERDSRWSPYGDRGGKERVRKGFMNAEHWKSSF